MAFQIISLAEIAVGKPIVKALFTKIKNSLDDLDSRVTAIASGSAPIEVFNIDVANASSALSLTGLLYHEALSGFTISKVKIQIFETGIITSGSLTVDVKKSTTDLDDPSFTSILTTLPTIDFTTATDYDFDEGVLDISGQSISEGDILRLDITSLPTIPLGKFRVLVYGVL
jgi:hypothetical protein